MRSGWGNTLFWSLFYKIYSATIDFMEVVRKEEILKYNFKNLKSDDDI